MQHIVLRQHTALNPMCFISAVWCLSEHIKFYQSEDNSGLLFTSCRLIPFVSSANSLNVINKRRSEALLHATFAHMTEIHRNAIKAPFGIGTERKSTYFVGLRKFYILNTQIVLTIRTERLDVKPLHLYI